ncbi:MAG: SRPBCC family protein [Halobacteriota archaeon]
MTRIEESVQIHRPVEEVFTYTTDAKSWPHWHGDMQEAEQTSAGQVGVDTTFKGKNRMWGQTLRWTAKVTEYDPYERWSLVIDSGSVIIDEELRFDPLEGGTRLTRVYDVKVSGLLRILRSRIIGSLRKQFKQDASTLKLILEAQS